MLSLRRPREWLFALALAVFFGATVFVPLLAWLLPGNFLVAGMVAVLAAVTGLISGHELWDRWMAAPHRPVTYPAAPRSKTEYLNDLIQRLSAEQDQYVPLAGKQAPYEVYGADYSADKRTEMLRDYKDIGEALAGEKHRRFVIIGAPGAGKTTTLRMLALAVARVHPQADGVRDAVIRALYGDDGPVPLPLWINLGWAENPPDAEKLLHTWWSEVEKLDGSVTDAMRDTQVWLFLDGLNEMPERGTSREERAGGMRDLFAREEFRNVRLVVTCRERDYAGSMRLGLPVVRVRPLDDPRVEAFAHYRLGNGAPGFLAALDAQPHLRELGRNPYTLVRLIAVYNEKEPLPETLEALHERHTRVRYAHEKEHGRVTIPLPRLERKLQRLAFRMIAAGKETSTDERWAQRQIGRLALEDAFQLNLLVVDERTGALSFYHQTLHQYFALPGLSRRLAQGSVARRVRFIRQIADFGEGGAPAIPALVKASRDPERDVMDAALVALSRVDRDGVVFRTAWQKCNYSIPLLPPREKAQWAREIADADVRPGVGLREDGLPDIDWVEIPEGEFIYQDGQRLTLPTFYIARYPVTYVQFQAFIDADDGFYNDAWWQGLAKRETKPGEPWFKYDNHPRETVSWYDAIAFCRWLTARVNALNPEGEGAGVRAEIRLPTEQQWEKAARGGLKLPSEKGGWKDNPAPQREYPYEDEFDPTKGNTYEPSIGQTSAVGIFPQGASPYGIYDMSGNVWEWCLNEYDSPENARLSGTARRVVRGGSWRGYLGYARCASRFGFDPLYRLSVSGLRVVCVPPSS